MTKRTTPRRVKAVARIWRDRVGFMVVCERPIWSLPRTSADYDAMLVQGSGALYKTEGKRLCRDEVVAAVLRSFGITRPRE